jgi:hypothetical protein
MTNSMERLVSLQQQYSSYEMEGSAIVVDTGDDFITVKQATDIYDGMYDLIESGDKYPTAKGLAVVTTGWAAPLNANGEVEGAPSAHPQRRRVRLVAYMSCEGMVSAVSFQDTDEVTYDEGQGQGYLADALKDTWASIAC